MKHLKYLVKLKIFLIFLFISYIGIVAIADVLLVIGDIFNSPALVKKSTNLLKILDFYSI